MRDKQILKKDLFGEVWLVRDGNCSGIFRSVREARWWLKWLARALLRREGRALAALHGMDGIPQVLEVGDESLLRTYLSGTPMYEARPQSAAYFRAAARLLRQLHRSGVVHNDLAKEPNILVRDDGSPAFIDFQLAMFAPQRGRFFRLAGREDLRHLLKHKRTYRPDLLTARERSILASPSPLSRVWMSTFKPVYLFVTRRIFGWADREGARDRGKTN